LEQSAAILGPRGQIRPRLRSAVSSGSDPCFHVRTRRLCGTDETYSPQDAFTPMSGAARLQRRAGFCRAPGETRGRPGCLQRKGNPTEHQEAFNETGVATRFASTLLFTTSVTLNRLVPVNASNTPHRPMEEPFATMERHPRQRTRLQRMSGAGSLNSQPDIRVSGGCRYTWPDFSMPDAIRARISTYSSVFSAPFRNNP